MKRQEVLESVSGTASQAGSLGKNRITIKRGGLRGVLRQVEESLMRAGKAQEPEYGGLCPVDARHRTEPGRRKHQGYLGDRG